MKVDVSLIKLFVSIAIVCTLLFAASRVEAASGYMLMPIDEIYDGDTIKTHVSTYRLPEPLNLFSVRINGIDTPESPAKSYRETGKLGRAKCIREAELALAATAEVQKLANGISTMKVSNFSHGKFGGRILGDVTIGGVDVATHLIAKGMAIEYHGEAKSHDWCVE